MYRYKCTAVENGGKQDFYDVTEELKVLYPELTENVGKRPDRKFLQREFVMGENHVAVRYSFSKQSVTVYSEERLEKYYGERKVEEGQFSASGKTGAGTIWAVSGIYFAIIALLIFTIFMIEPDTFDTDIPIVPILILAVVNTLAGIFIRRLTGMSFPKRILCLAVGFVTAFAVLICIVNLAFGPSFLDFLVGLLVLVGLVFLLLHLFLPAFVISLLLQGVTELIIKKIYGSKTAKGEDMTETK